GASVIEFDWTVNLNHAACQAADVAHIFQVMREDHDGKGTRHFVFAEVEEVDSLLADFNPQNLSRHAFGLADMTVGFVDRDAVGRGEDGRCEHNYQKRDPVCHGMTDMASRGRALPGWTAEGGCPHMRCLSSEHTPNFRNSGLGKSVIGAE
ncbi:MAG TPA: hypothetical protein VEV41_20165, partial [Terriglobales bacterium]|nr:hypothetical protein [Terriglobales bacterium]